MTSKSKTVKSKAALVAAKKPAAPSKKVAKAIAVKALAAKTVANVKKAAKDMTVKGSHENAATLTKVAANIEKVVAKLPIASKTAKPAGKAVEKITQETKPAAVKVLKTPNRGIQTAASKKAIKRSSPKPVVAAKTVSKVTASNATVRTKLVLPTAKVVEKKVEAPASRGLSMSSLASMLEKSTTGKPAIAPVTPPTMQKQIPAYSAPAPVRKVISFADAMAAIGRK